MRNSHRYYHLTATLKTVLSEKIFHAQLAPNLIIELKTLKQTL